MSPLGRMSSSFGRMDDVTNFISSSENLLEKANDMSFERMASIRANGDLIPANVLRRFLGSFVRYSPE